MGQCGGIVIETHKGKIAKNTTGMVNLPVRVNSYVIVNAES